MAKLISINNATAGYDDKIVLSNVSLDISDNDFIGIIGPNGGGKTTLIKLILKQLHPISGSVQYSLDIENNGVRQIGYLPQINNIDRAFPISVKEVILSGLQSQKGIFGRYNKADMAKVYSIMSDCNILHLKNKSIGEISGGELQRTFLCRALISSPKLLILDEPNTFVDNKFEKELYELLKSLNNRMAIVMVSHDLGTITSYVKSIACVNRTLHHHNSNTITQEQLLSYDCPILLVAHGNVPHTVLPKH